MHKRNITTYSLEERDIFYTKMLNWMNQFNIFCLLQTNSHIETISQYDWIAGIGSIHTPSNNLHNLESLDDLYNQKDWHFGHLGYNLKNEIEAVYSNKEDKIGFENCNFFCPEIVLYLKNKLLTIESYSDNNSIYQSIQDYSVFVSDTHQTINIKETIDKSQYISDVNNLKNHIQKGDCYEINYCMSFYATDVEVNPIHIYQKLCRVSPNPFAAFYKNEDKYVMSASPERFLKKENNKLISQPIKGTIKRDIENEANDHFLKVNLSHSSKEISENIMIVDLVRNDLSKICEPNTVMVTELHKTYTFPQVHHLISTIEGVLKEGITFSDIIKATFPMGSMTGAPKKRVLELIEQYEKTNRGIFSGAIGYIKPDGDFDFNVVIRSIMYNSTLQYLHYLVGSGITIYCDAKKEYDECVLKAKAMEKALQ